MPSVLIVTASDAGFFKLLTGCLLSLEAHRGTRPIDIGFFDLGLSAAQRDWVRPRVTETVEPGWDLELPAALRETRPHLRALTVRPFLPRHFPGYDIYLWIDADVWLQDWRGVELYCFGAHASDLTVTPHTDRAYPFNRAVSRHAYGEFVQAYGKDVADEIVPRQIVNAGIFAARRDSPLWQSWAEAYQEAIITSHGAMMSDQTALNFVVYRRGLKVHLLPALYNWQSHLALPMWNPKLEKFCEPYLPHATISMMHLTHRSKDRAYDIRGLDGRIRRMTLHNPRVAAAELSALVSGTGTDGER